MSVPNTRHMKRRPTHPGEMLRDDFMSDYGLTVAGLAEFVGASRQSINELLRGRRAVSPEMALRLSRLFGSAAEFWLNAQRAICGTRPRPLGMTCCESRRYVSHHTRVDPTRPVAVPALPPRRAAQAATLGRRATLDAAP